MHSLAALPIAFEPNVGQSGQAVRFLAHTAGGLVLLTSQETVLAVSAPPAPSRPSLATQRTLRARLSHTAGWAWLAHQPRAAATRAPATAVVRLRYQGANPRPRLVGLDRLPGVVNYYLGANRHDWRTGLPTYGEVAYRDVYPGVDLIYHGQSGKLEYDFVVHPGANPAPIRLAVSGGQRPHLDGQGNLVLGSGATIVRQLRPVVYQMLAGRRQPIPAGYLLGAEGQVRFTVGRYNRAAPLVIDPVLSYGTYLGGSSDEQANGLAVDAVGDAYATGDTFSSNFPVTPGAPQTIFGGDVNYGDAFVSELNPAGTALVYSTYLGGSGDDSGHGIATDSNGNAYVTGFTESAGFPITAGALQSALGGYRNAFVTKLNALGQLVYSTYLGGNGGDNGTALAVDSAGDAYITGSTNSTNFPGASNALQGDTDAFVTELNAGATAQVYSLYLGGSGGGGISIAHGIALDNADNGYVTGATNAVDFPTTAGAFEPSAPSGLERGLAAAFVTKISTTGTEIYGTFLSGQVDGFYNDISQDAGYSIAVDPEGNAFVTGEAGQPDFPTTAGVLQASYGGTSPNCSTGSCGFTTEAFVSKLNAAGSTLLFSTYLGGNGIAVNSYDDYYNDFNYGQSLGDAGYAITLDTGGDVYVSGDTQSDNFPITPGAFQTSFAAATQYSNVSASFMSVLAPDGSALLYSTYLDSTGTTASGAAYGIALDSANGIHVAGATGDTTFPTTSGVVQGSSGGGQDAYVAKFDAVAPTSTPTITGTPPTSVPTATDTPTVTGTPPTATPSATDTVTPTNSPTDTFTQTDTATSTDTSTATPTPIPLEITRGANDPGNKKPGCNKTRTPVNCASGEFWHSFQDLLVPGRGLPLDLTRTYDSGLAGQDEGFGYGWAASYALALTVDSSGVITMREDNGSTNRFTPTGGGAYSGPPGGTETLSVNGDGTYTLLRQDQSQDVFSAPTIGSPGQLLREVDRHGTTTSLAYTNGQLSTVTDPAGRALTFSYTGSRVNAVSDGTRSVSFTYDARGNLTDYLDAGGGHWRFTYDANHLLLTMTDPNQSGANPPAVVTNLYNAQGQVISQTDPMSRTTTFAYTTNQDGSQSTTITDPKGDVTLETFAQGEPITITKGYGTAQAAIWHYTYDPASGQVATTLDPNGHLSSNTYDAVGNLISQTDPLSRTTTYAYDGQHDLTAVTDPAGLTTYMTYDGQGDLTSIVRPLARALPTASLTPTGAPSPAPSPVALSEVAVTSGSAPYGVTAGADGRLWFTEPGTNKIGAMTLNGTVSEYPLAAGSNPGQIVAGPDGNLWFTERGTGKIGRITPSSVLTEYALGATTQPYAITAGPDGNLWFTEAGANKIGRITTSGGLTLYSLPSGSTPHGITTGPNGLIWFTEFGSKKIGRIAVTGGAVTTTTIADNSQPEDIATAADGSLWYTVYGTAEVTHISAAGVILGDISLTPGSTTEAIRSGPDGNLWLTEYGADEVARLAPDGTLTTYTLPTANAGPAGLAYGPDGNLWVAESTANQLCRIALAAVTTMTYDPSHPGDLTSITDPNGYATSYTYDPATGNLLGISDPLSDTTTLAYDALGRVTNVVSADGNANGATPSSYTTTLAYNPYGDVTSVTDPLLAGQATPAVTTYGYDANRNLMSIRLANGATTTYGYDADNEQTTVTQPTPTGTPTGPAPSSSASYDAAGNLQAYSDFDGHQISYSYDPLNRLMGVSQVVSQPSPVGTQTRVTSYQYDGAGNLVRMTDPLGLVTTHQYDGANQAIGAQHLDSQGHLLAGSSVSYGPDGQVIGSTDANGHTTTLAYDSLGRAIGATDPLTHTTSAVYDPAGNLLQLRDPLGLATSDGYDAANRASSQTLADGAQSSGAYDAEGNLIAATDPNNRTTRYSYDALDRLTSVLNAKGKTTSYGYDLVGNLVSVRQPLNPAILSTYDPLGRLLSVNDQHNPPTTYGYDPNGNRTSTTDGNGHTTQNQYDEASELTTVIQPGGATQLTQYTADGQVQDQINADGQGTSYSYDGLGQLAGITDPLSRTTTYAFDPVGNLRTLTDPQGRVTTYGYDAVNEPQQISYSDGATPNVSMSYTADGQRASLTDGTGTTTYGYDSRGRLASLKNGAGQTVSYGYDPASNLTSLTYPGSHKVTRGYDVLNELTSVKDWLSHTTTFAYDNNGNLTDAKYPTTNHVGAHYSYDAAGGLTGITDNTNAQATPTPFWQYGYTLDGNQQVTGASDPVQSNAHHTYSLNALNQLTADQTTGPISDTTTWSNDPAGQPTGRTDQASGAVTSETTDAAGELTGLTTTISGTTSLSETLTANLDGDRTGWTDSVSGQSAALSYDQADRLTGVSGTGVLTPTTYAYNGDGLRMSSTTAITTSQAFWDPSQAAPSLLQEGTTSYLTGPGGVPLEQIDGAGNVLYALSDQLGSVRGLVDASGAVQDSYVYDPYGQRTAISGSTGATPFGYTGAYTDAATGYSYLQARYYDPATAQFLSRDPLAGLTGSPYSYVYDNPLNGTDPLGLCPSWLPCTVVNALGATKDKVGSAGGHVAGRIGSAVSSGYSGFSQGVGQWQDVTTQAFGQLLPALGQSLLHPTVGNPATAMLMGDITPVIGPRQVVKMIAPVAQDVACAQYAKAVGYGVATLVSAGLLAPLGGEADVLEQGPLDVSSAFTGSAADNIYSSITPLEPEFPELAGVNPYYVEGAGPGVNTNCVSCVNAAQRRLTGVDLQAIASPSQGYGIRNDLLPSAPFGFQPGPTTPAAVEEQLQSAGDGAVGVVLIDQGSGIFHVINVVNRRGHVYFIDPQLGAIVTLKPNLDVQLGRP